MRLRASNLRILRANEGIPINLETFGPDVCVADFDGDGFQDIYFVNGRDLYSRGIPSRNALYRNNGDGTFTDVTVAASFPGTGYGLGCVWEHYDNDGFMDVVVANNGNPPRLLRDSGGNGIISLTSSSGPRRATGARWARACGVQASGLSQVREVAGGVSYLSQSDPRAHFGLGKAKWAETVELHGRAARNRFSTMWRRMFLAVCKTPKKKHCIRKFANDNRFSVETALRQACPSFIILADA